MSDDEGIAGRIIDLYERHARVWAQDRGEAITVESHWLERFVTLIAPGATVLDLGCGSGQPIARYLIERHLDVVGVDSSATMIAMCRERFPQQAWICADMRSLALERKFGALLAWDSVFHLQQAHQRAMFAVFEKHSLPGALLMFTSGHRAGPAVGSYGGEPLYHDSLDPDEYRSLLTRHGFELIAYKAQDPDCGHHTVWLARFARNA